MVPRATGCLIVATAAVLAVATAPARGQAAGDVLPYSLATEHLFVYYAEGRSDAAEEIARRAEQCIEQVAGLTGLAPTRRIRLYLADTQQQFEALVGQPESFSILGRADASDSVIVVRAGGGPEMNGLLAHETLHIVLGQALEGSGAMIPLWLNEGLAEWVAGEVTHDGQPRRVVTAARVLPLQQLSSHFPRDPAGVNLAYAESRSFVQFVQQRTGDRGLRRLVASLRAEKSIEPAFEAAYGKSLDAFEAEWRPQFASGVRHPIPIDPLTAIFMAMSLLFVVVVVLRTRRAWKRRREENEEEEDDDYEDPYWNVPGADAEEADRKW